VIALLLLLLTQDPARMPPARPVVAVPTQECPVVFLERVGGLGTESQGGIIFAAWESGIVVRAESPKQPWGPHTVGVASSADLAELLKEVKESRLWSKRSKGLAVDMPEESLVIQRGQDRIGWSETPGVTSTRELEQIRQKLLGLSLQQRRRVTAPIDVKWKCPPATWVE
jgi:hypothetical protein